MYPQTGVYIGLEETKEFIEQNKWTNIKDWKTNIGNEKVWFKEDIDFVSHSSFVAPRSGLYYVSLYLEFMSPHAGKYYLNVTVTKNNSMKEKYLAKSASDTIRTHVQTDDILLIDKNDTINIYLWSSNRYRLTKNSRLFLQFINGYQNIIGFVANPLLDTTVSNNEPQVLVGWQTKYDIVNGFSKTTGSYVTISDGYYLILLKLIISNVRGRFIVQIYENKTNFCNIEKEYRGLNRWETITYTGVRMFSSRTKISLKLYSNWKSSYVSIDSSYSIIFLTSQRTSCGIHYYYLKENTRVKPNITNYIIQKWNVANRCNMVYNNEFSVPKSGYYLITLDIYIDKLPLKIPHVILKFSFQYHTVSSVFGEGDSRRFTLSGIFFVNEKMGITCFIKSSEAITMLKKSVMSIYEITYETNTHLYTLANVKNIVDSNRSNRKHTLKIIQSSGSNDLLMLTQNDKSLKIIKSGIYYLVLNVYLGNSTKYNLDFNIMHRSVEGRWNLLTKCYVYLSSNCYIPMTLLLYENEEISISKSSVIDSHQEPSFFFVQFIQSQQTNMEFSEHVKYRTYKSGRFLSKSISLNETDPFGEGILAIYKGVYLITYNIVIKTNEAYKNILRKVKLTLQNSNKVILRIKKNMLNTSYINIVCTRTHHLPKNARLRIRLTITDVKNSPLEWKLEASSYFSILLVTEDEGKYFSVDGRIRIESSTGEMFVVNPKFGKESKYIKYFYTIQPLRSFFALLSVTLIGEACQESDASFMTFSVRLKDDKNSWPHMRLRKYITKGTSQPKCQIISLHLSGMVIVYRDDMIEVGFVMSNKLRFTPAVGTSLSLVVMDESGADIPFSYFARTPIPFGMPPVVLLDKGMEYFNVWM